MNTSNTIFLPDEAATLRFGRALGDFFRLPETPRLLLLRGTLGSGKTCLIRGMVSALPGGEKAEVASPTFSMCNLYPCTPAMAHVDLYRTGMTMPSTPAMPLSLDDEVLDIMDDGTTLLCIEWAEFFPSNYLPDSYIELDWLPMPEGRQVWGNAHNLSTKFRSAFESAFQV